jgi:hypothetical protein
MYHSRNKSTNQISYHIYILAISISIITIIIIVTAIEIYSIVRERVKLSTLSILIIKTITLKIISITINLTSIVD